MTRPKWLTMERVGQAIQLAIILFLAVYVLAFVGGQRERLDCQDRVNTALLESLTASRDAAQFERTAMQTLVQGLLTPGAKVDPLLLDYQESIRVAASIRVDNPLPNPNCS